MQIKLCGEVYWTEDLVQSINEAQEDIDLVIDSPGGDVFEGLQVVNAIQQCPHKVTAHVEVISASIAAVITLACDKFTIRKNDLFMLHNCWTWAAGNKEELQEQVAIMEKIDKILQDVVSEHCTEAEAVIEKMNAGDYWLSGDEVADLFDNCELIERPVKENSIAASGMTSIIKALKEKPAKEEPKASLTVEDLNKALAEFKAEIIEACKPKEEPYVMSNELKELMAFDE